MKKALAFIGFQLIFISLAVGQGKLKPSIHGIQMMTGDVSKDTIIKDVRFADGVDEKVDVLRFDNAGAASGNVLPLIISTKLPVPSDELGMLAIKLQENTMKELLHIIENCEVKVHKRPKIQYGLIRVTFRFNSKLDQYYITDLKGSSKVFKQIEQELIKLEDKSVLRSFYNFLLPSTLIEVTKEGIKWKYL